MSSKFVEFTESNAKNTPLFLRPEDVATVAVCGGETIISCSEKQFYYVTASPAEVVAKLQQPEPKEKQYFADAYLRGLVARWQESGSLSVREWNALNEETKRILGETVAAPPAESEAVQLLERWLWSHQFSPEDWDAARKETTALLAKLKGGK